ncbi:DUF4254 domain-containing protein [Nocardia sp. R7R-8]|uniref:DUF4254 domain-containing protein n=1 Tax=Nocardia sp. R7R-8 TaxID=3459304 RepID=UPI00403DB99B
MRAAMHLPVPHSGARLHTETLGAVIDRLARSQVRAYHLLMTVDDVADPQVHAAWYRCGVYRLGDPMPAGGVIDHRQPGPLPSVCCGNTIPDRWTISLLRPFVLSENWFTA